MTDDLALPRVRRRVTAYLFILPVVLLIATVALWPASYQNQAGAATSAVPLDNATVTLSMLPTSPGIPYGSAILLVVVLAGALGGYVHTASAFRKHRLKTQDSAVGYIIHPIIGAALAPLVFAALDGTVGLAAGAVGGQSYWTPTAALLVGGLSGLFTKKATSKLKQVADKIFGKDERDERPARALEVKTATDPVDSTVDTVASTTDVRLLKPK